MDTKYVRSTPYIEESFQLLLKSTDFTNANPTEFPIDIQGDVEIEINAIQVRFSTDPTYIRFEIQSPELQFHYGNVRYIQVSYPFPAHNLASGDIKYKFSSYLNGKITINLIDPSTKLYPTNLTEVVLSGCVRRI